MIKTIALLLALCVHAAPVWAINKCTDETGKVTYQDEKCPPGKSEEIKITGNAAPAESGYYAGPSSSGAGAYTTPYPSSPPYDRSSVYSGGSGAVHTGPRGGRYTIGPSGNKNYISRGKR